MKKYILLFFSFLLCLTADAQKYKKNSFFDNGEKRIYYEIFYKSGYVGLSVDTKQNVICGEDRGYTKIERTHTGVKTFIVKKGNFSGVIDMNGNEIIKPNRYQYVDDEIEYASGCSAFRYYKVGNGGSQYSPEKQGICSVTGEEIIPCLYKRIELDKIIYKYNDKDYAGFYFKTKTPQNHIALSDTLNETLFYSDKYDYAYIMMKKEASSPEFKDNILGYAVGKNYKSGFCDKEGNELISPLYEQVSVYDTFGYRLFHIKQNGKWGVLSGNQQVIIKPLYDHIYQWQEHGYRYFQVEENGKCGILTEEGKIIIKPVYDKVYYMYKNENFAYFNVKQNGKEGICDISGNEIIPPLYNSIIWSGNRFEAKSSSGKWIAINTKENAESVQTDDIETQRANLAERTDKLSNKIQDLEAKISSNRQSTQSTASTSTSSYFSPSSSNNYYAPSSSSSYSSNTNSQYKALNDPNLVDNSEKIANAHKLINDLESQKRTCTSCHGTGSVPKVCTVCRGTGTCKIGYYTPQYFTCTWCQGTGKEKTQCMACYQTNMQISFAQSLLKTLQETHGMTKETLNTYIEIKAMEHKQNMEFQKAINEIAEPYLNSTRKSNSSDSSTSSSSKCSMCNGTGIDSHAYYSGDPKPAVGGYTHSSGRKCIYCGKYEWHQHVYCPKCNANKYP